MAREKEVVIPITYDGWDEGGNWGETQFYEVIFTEDFGPFKKNDKVACLWVSMLAGEVREYGNEGEVLRSIKVKFVPVEP